MEKENLLEIPMVGLMPDEQDFVVLMQKSQERIYRLAFYLLGNEEDAKDATQETLLKAWKKFDRLKLETFQPWLLKIVVNLCLDWLRKRKFNGRFMSQEDGSQDDLERRLTDPKPDPLEQCISQEMQIMVREAVLKLPPPYRAIVILRDLEGLTYQEISEALGIPVSKVKSDLFRGRRYLKETLRPFFEESK